MVVTVMKDGVSTDYMYAPEHLSAVYVSYSKMLDNKEIDSFTITTGRTR